MTNYQQAVLWMGLLLIILKLFSSGQWGSLWGTISNGHSAFTQTPTKPASQHPAAGNPSQPNICEFLSFGLASCP